MGNAGAELNFSAVRLARVEARIEGHHLRPGARQAESRSHGFFYRSTGADEGLLGLPVVGVESARQAGSPGRGNSGGRPWWCCASAGCFSRRWANCRRNAVHQPTTAAWHPAWTGTATRGLLGQRGLALMGYELVEGELSAQGGPERITERRRLDFAPRHKALLQMRPTPFD